MYTIMEITDESSCLNKALSHEMIFVLLARDKCAPATIRAWVGFRVESGANKLTDETIVSALKCAEIMELHRDEIRQILGKD